MSTIKNWFNWRTIWTLSSIRAKKHSAAHFQIMSIQLISAYIIRPKIGRLLARYLAPAEQLLVDHRFAEPPPAWHTEATSDNLAALVASCDIDHSVAPSIDIRGGRIAAEQRLRDFLENDLRRYALYRNEPSAKATSGLSPYLHFGYLSSLEAALAAREHAERHKLIAEEFLEELIVRRELAFNFARHMSWPATLDDLPEWARKTLAKHSSRWSRSQHLHQHPAVLRTARSSLAGAGRIRHDPAHVARRHET